MVQSAKELISERLKAVSEEITPEDRKAAEALGYSHVTLSKYLNGDGPNADLGLKIYEFFAGRIKERIDRIKAIA